MPNVQPQLDACTSCQGRGFVFLNREGHVQAETCSCYQCGLCGGEGRVFYEKENGVAFLSDCDCTLMKKRFRILSDAGIPGKFLNADFDSYDKGKQSQGRAKRIAMDFVKDWVEGKGKKNAGLVFMGDPGLGKTHLSVAILKTLILQHGVDCRFVDFFQLLSDIRHGYSQDLSDQAILYPYLRSRVLVIDELAKGRNTEWELTVLDQLISSRYNAADKVTLFTTNYPSELAIRHDAPSYSDNGDSSFADGYTRERLQDKIGARIYSRLAEMCKFVMIQGQDFRQKGLSKTQRFPR